MQLLPNSVSEYLLLSYYRVFYIVKCAQQLQYDSCSKAPFTLEINFEINFEIYVN